MVNPKIGLILIGLLGIAASIGVATHMLSDKDIFISTNERKRMEMEWINQDRIDGKYEFQLVKAKEVLKNDSRKKRLIAEMNGVGKSFVSKQSKEKIKVLCEDRETRIFARYKKYYSTLREICIPSS